MARTHQLTRRSTTLARCAIGAALASAWSVASMSPSSPAVTPTVSAATGASCPTGTDPFEFFWQRDAGGSDGAVFPHPHANSTDINTGYTETYPVDASGVDLQVTVTDTADRLEDGDNALLNYSAGNWDTPIYTGTDGSNGLDRLTVAMNSLDASEEANFNFAFTKPVLLPNFDVTDIDFVYTTYTGTSIDDLHDSYQDEVRFAADRAGGNVGVTLTQGSVGTGQPLLPGGQTALAGPWVDTDGGLNPGDAEGTVHVSTNSPITNFDLFYSNGPDDAAGDLTVTSGDTTTPEFIGDAGVSNNHGIGIGSFTVCVGTLSIGQLVFADYDGDGVQDADEPGLGAVPVELRDPTNHLLDTVNSSLAGGYSFDQLPPLTYTVTPDQSGLPAGTTWTPTVDGDATADGTTDVVLVSSNNTTTDFGYQPEVGTIAGHAYADPEDDGVVGADDTPISGVTVTLTGSDVFGTTFNRQTTTNAGGSYSFANVPAGTFAITETQPVVFADGADVVGTNGVTSPSDDVFSFSPDWGDSTADNDFFEVPQASLAGTVFDDADNGGTQNGPEGGISGVTVTITGTDSAGHAVSRTATTNGSGHYTFTALRAGTYTVTESQPGGYLDGTDTVGTAGGTLAPSDGISGVVLGSATTASGYDFGERAKPSIAGSVVDVHGAPLEGVTITLTPPTGPDQTTTTAIDGTFLFDDLAVGSYTITETQPLGYADGSETVGTGGGSAAVDDTMSGITLGAATAASGYVFTEGYASIGGTVWHDLGSENGTIDSGEPGISNVSIALDGLDATGASVHRTTTTVSDGSYVFDDLLGGTYTLTETQPTAYNDGPDLPGSEGGSAATNDVISAITLPTGATATDYDFAEHGTVLSGTVWVDDNGNGVIEPAETMRVNGVTITLFAANGTTQLATTTTASDGTYAFGHLAVGSYVVTETQPSGYATTTNNSRNAAVVLGGLTGVDFGEQLGSIGDFVWVDSNGNGVQDAEEVGAANVVVTLLDNTGTPITTLTTVTGGAYRFIHLPAGTYSVQFTAPNGQHLTRAGLGSTENDSDPDWITGRTPQVSLAIAACTQGPLNAPVAGTCVDALTSVDAGVVPVDIDLAVTGTVSASGPVSPGTEVTFTFVGSNSGNVPVLDGARLNLVAPTGLTPLTASGTGWTCVVNAANVLCVRSDSSLPGDVLPPVTVVARVESFAGALNFSAAIGTLHDETETTFANNTASLPVTVVQNKLPRTGGNVLAPLSVAAAMILVGITALVLGRRRPTVRPPG